MINVNNFYLIFKIYFYVEKIDNATMKYCEKLAIAGN
jgi:hypothetical protein